MKQKVQPQGLLDILTPSEFGDVMQRHTDTLLTALGRNARFIRYIEQVLSSTQSLSISPPDGFLWEVKAIIPMTTSGLTTDTLPVYFNNITPANLIMALPCNSGIVNFPGKTIIVHSTDSLVFQSSGDLNATVQLLIIEVPNSHEAQLLL